MFHRTAELGGDYPLDYRASGYATGVGRKDRKALDIISGVAMAGSQREFSINTFIAGTRAAWEKDSILKRAVIENRRHQNKPLTERVLANLAIALSSTEVNTLDVFLAETRGDTAPMPQIKLGVFAAAQALLGKEPGFTPNPQWTHWYLAPGHIPDDPNRVLVQIRSLVAKTDPYPLTLVQENIWNHETLQPWTVETSAALVRTDFFVLRIPRAGEVGRDFADEVEFHIGHARSAKRASGDPRYATSYPINSETLHRVADEVMSGQASAALLPAATVVTYSQSLKEKD